MYTIEIRASLWIGSNAQIQIHNYTYLNEFFSFMLFKYVIIFIFFYLVLFLCLLLIAYARNS